MPLVKIKPGTGKHTTWQAGVAVIHTFASPPFEVSEQVYRDFRDKLVLAGQDSEDLPETEAKEEDIEDTAEDELVTEVGATEIDVPATSISDIMAAIEAGQLDVQVALDQETKSDRPRQSLVKKLVSIIEGSAS